MKKILIALSLLLPIIGHSQIIATSVGTGVAGYSGDGSLAINAKINLPIGCFTDAAGNLYISDQRNNCIRKVNTSGIISTIAGTGIAGYSGDGGLATAAQINTPGGVFVDASGNVYFADGLNNRIRKINTSGIISTIAGNGTAGYSGDGIAAVSAELNNPIGIAVDAAGNFYIGDQQNQRVRKVSASGTISTIAGTGTSGYSGDSGPASTAQISYPNYVIVDATGNVFLTDNGNHRIRKINTSGTITTIAGNGSPGYSGDLGLATAAKLYYPAGIRFDSTGSLYIADYGNNVIRKVNSGGIISTIAGDGVGGYAGDGGLATLAKLNEPSDIAVGHGYFYMADYNNSRMRVLDYAPHFTGGHIQTLSVCENSIVDPVNSLLAVIDTDAGQTETWSIVTAPAHGTAVVAYTTISTGGILTPTGLSYTPLAGYSGTDVIKVRVTDGIASDTTQINVVVNALPVAGTILGSSTVCAGSSITLSDTLAGTWNSTNTAIATVGSSSGVVTGITAGVVEIICISTNSCGSDTAYKAVTVDALPSAILGGLSVCVGGTTQLTDAVSGGSWASSTPGVATISSGGLVTGVSVGTSTITYMLTTGCFATTVVTVTSAPATILGSLTVCVGATTQLTDISSGGTWVSSTPGVATVSSGALVTGISAGTTTISYSLGSCHTTSIVTVVPTPTITGSHSLCVGITDTLTGPSGSTWSSSTPAVATVSTAGLVTGLSAGVATITCVASTGCIATFSVTVNPSPTAILGGSGVSIGGTLPLSDATGGGTWSSSNISIATVGTTGIVTGVSSGVITITYKLPTGCYATHSVQVSGTFVVGPINGIATVCAGGGALLTDSTAGGVWSSSNNAIAAVGSSTGIVSAFTVGTCIISYTVGTTSATVIFTVAPLVSVISGSTSVCVGSTTNLTDSVSGGTWNSSTTGVATVSSGGVVTGISPGTTLISYTLAGCFATKIVTVNPGPAISGSTSVCTGGTTTLSTTAGSVTWNSSNTSVATVGATTGIVTGVSAGVATITCVASTGCHATIVVTVNASSPILPTGAVSICLGGTAALTDATGGGAWSSSTPAVATVGGIGIVTGVAIGTSTISYILTSGCIATKIVTVNNAPVAITPHNPSVCLGSTLLLTDATSGGTWTSTVTGVATISSGGLVTSVAAGITEIDYSIGTCIARDTFTVLSGPAAITPGAVTLCLGGGTSLTDATAGGTWSSSSVSIVSVTTGGAITSHAIGTATISYTIGSCSATTVVTVNTAPGAISPATTSVCAGSSTTLTDAVSGGVWSSSNTTVATVAGGVVTGITAGTATISYSIGSCSSTAIVTVNPAPGTISGGSTVLAGSQITLSDATTGGTWSSSNTSVATVGSSTGIVTGVSAGTVTIYYTTAGGCQTSHIVTVTALGGIHGTANVCAGYSVTLIDSTAGGNWSSSNTSIATVGSSTGIVTGVAAGTCTISYTVGTSVTTITFTVYAAPGTISGSSTVTAGSQITLSDAVTGGTWSSSNTSVATVGSGTGIVTGVIAGIVTISYTTTGGCLTTHIVTVTALTGIHGTASVCAGSSVTLIDSTAGGHWSSSNTGIATVGSSTGIVTGVSAGTCIISYTVGTSVTTITFTVFAVPATISGSGTVTAGSNITLSDAVTGGTWSSSNTSVATVGSSTGIVTGVSAGTVIITYTTAGGCQTTHGVTVTALGGITGTANVCAGSSVTLNDTTAGGHWSSSNTAIATVGSSTGIVTGVAAGTCVISYTLGTSSSTVVFTVYAAPATISGGSTVIAGTTLTLSDAVAGGTWSSSNTSVATVAAGTVTGVSPGTVIISYTMAGGCQVTHIVTVTALTGISGTASACAGSTITLTDANAGGHWSSSNTGIASVGSSSGVVTGVSAGTCTISYTLGTSSVMVTFTVNPSPAAISGASTVIVGFTLTLSDAVAGGTWSSSGTSIATVASGVVTAVSPGTVTIGYTLAGGCETTHIVTVTALPGIQGTDNVCIGSTRTLTDSIAGGHWSSSNTAIATIGSSTGVVTGISSGTCTLTYTVGTNITTVTFTVNFAAPISGSLVVSVGGTTTLSDASGGGVWLSSLTPVATAGSATGVVTGISAGTATIYYVVTLTGCSTSVVVTVNIPIHAIHGAASVCDGSTITLADSTSGGVWSSSNTAIATVGSSTGVVTGVSSGICTISYTVGSASATFTVTANAAPAILGSSIVGLGGTITLSDASPGGTWLSSLTTVATVGSATGIVNGIAGGTATIYYVTTAGCYAYHIVTVTTTPAVHSIGGITSACEGSTRTLTDSTAGGHWSSSNTAIATVGSSTGVVTGISGGTCIITYTVGAGFATIVFTVDAVAPISGATTVHAGSTITLSDAVAGGLWSSGSATIATVGSSTGIVTGESVGSVNIYYVTAAGCLSYHAVTVTASGGRESGESTGTPDPMDAVTFNLFPNPASDNINVTWQGQLSDAGQITVTDMAGHVVYTSAIDLSNSAHQVQIPASGFKNGMYLLDIVSGNTHSSSKISVMK